MLFADRITESSLKLKDKLIDDSMISKGLHCLSRLKEGMKGSSINKNIAMKWMFETNLPLNGALESLDGLMVEAYLFFKNFKNDVTKKITG